MGLKFTHCDPEYFKVRGLWYLVRSEHCAAIASVQFPNVFITPEENSEPLNQQHAPCPRRTSTALDGRPRVCSVQWISLFWTLPTNGPTVWNLCAAPTTVPPCRDRCLTDAVTAEQYSVGPIDRVCLSPVDGRWGFPAHVSGAAANTHVQIFVGRPLFISWGNDCVLWLLCVSLLK